MHPCSALPTSPQHAIACNIWSVAAFQPKALDELRTLHGEGQTLHFLNSNSPVGEPTRQRLWSKVMTTAAEQNKNSGDESWVCIPRSARPQPAWQNVALKPGRQR